MEPAEDDDDVDERFDADVDAADDKDHFRDDISPTNNPTDTTL